jgi:hypothetical protein
MFADNMRSVMDGNPHLLKRSHLAALVVLVIFTAWPGWAQSREPVIDESARPNYLYVITAQEGAYAGRTLTLKKVSLVTLYFTDQPARIVGHMPTQEWVNRFSPEGSLADADPPNGVLSVLGASDNKEVVLELKEPKLDSETLRFRARFLRGSLPASFGLCTLFMEAVPGSPVLRESGRTESRSEP